MIMGQMRRHGKAIRRVLGTSFTACVPRLLSWASRVRASSHLPAILPKRLINILLNCIIACMVSRSHMCHFLVCQDCVGIEGFQLQRNADIGTFLNKIEKVATLIIFPEE